MTPEQKIKWLILECSANMKGVPPPEYPCADIDTLYENNEDYDAIQEVRTTGTETHLETPFSRHYEVKAVAAKLPDNTWVGWNYWYGGGKHSEPEAIDWIQYAYDVTCTEVMQPVKVFEKV